MRRAPLRAPRWIGLALAAMLGLWQAAEAAVAPQRPAGTMHDLQDHFAACFHPPKQAAGSRITFYFSLNTRGEVVASPRIVWFGFKGSEAEKARNVADFRTAFAGCLPLGMSAELATTIPGKVYFLQYVVAAGGETSAVLLRPFGSHGGGLQEPPNLDVEPVEPVAPQTAPIPMTGPPPPLGIRRQPPEFGPLVGPFRIRPRAPFDRPRMR